MGKLFDFSRKIYANRSVIAVRKGLLIIFPLIIIGSFSTFFQYLPSTHYADFMLRIFGSNWQIIFGNISSISTGIISITLVVTISYSMAEERKSMESDSFFPLITSVVGLMCYFTLSMNNGAINIISFVSDRGVFIAILSSIVSAKLLISLYLLFRKKFGNTSLDADPVLSQALLSIIPAIVVVVLFTIMAYLIGKLGFTNVNDVIFFWVYKLFDNIGNSFFKLILLTLMIQIMWFFGIHGNMVLSPVLSSTLSKLSAKSVGMIDAEAVNGLNTEQLTRTFLDVFVLIGGSGTTLCLLIAIFIAARRTNTIGLAKISWLPAIFNINEIIIFGLPIVLNPVFFLPFLITPVVMLLTAYFAIIAGLVPPVSATVNWTTPPLLNAYLACGSIKGVFLQIFNILVGTALYLPFIRANEKEIKSDLQSTYVRLIKLLENKRYGTRLTLLNRNDSVGYLAGMLSKEINSAIKNDEFLLEYQPLMRDDTNVIGVEALLRWPHKRFGWISPIITTAIAEEAGSMNGLGKWVIRKACSQLALWNMEGHKDICMSINISPTQLQDISLTDELIQCIKENGIEASNIELEITESIVLELDSRTKENIERLKAVGIKLAMDDFGMGYTSLLYIRHFNIDTIKIDGSITRDILKDKNCQDIVSSMVYLCNTLNIKVTAEYVEEERQFELLKLLGCSEFQGYLFSQPLPPDKAIQFINDKSQSIEQLRF